MNTKLNEFFALPIGLKEIKIFGDMKLYTSDSLKKKYINMISHDNKLSNVSGLIEKLVNEDLIIPCFLTKGIISTIMFKMFPTDNAKSMDQFYREEFRDVFGFYESGSKKIYILISNQINKIGLTNNDIISMVTTHESAHMAAAKNPGQFMSTFNNILFEYYKNYFTNIFKLKNNNENDKIIKDIIRFLFNDFEKSTNIDSNGLKKYHKLISKFKENSELKDFDEMNHNLFLCITLFTKGTKMFIKNKNKFNYILNPLQLSYKNIFNGIDYNNIPIQEVLFPSEVIAIGSEISNKSDIIKNIYKLIT